MQLPEAGLRQPDITVLRRAPPERDDEAARIADLAISTWRAIDAAFTPVIGRKAVAALFTRSVHLAAKTHPWLAGVHQDAQALEPAALKPVLAQQSRAEAALANHALLETFDRLLGSLIGPSLTERLLRAAREAAACGAPQRQELAAELGRRLPELTLVMPARPAQCLAGLDEPPPQRPHSNGSAHDR